MVRVTDIYYSQDLEEKVGTVEEKEKEWKSNYNPYSLLVFTETRKELVVPFESLRVAHTFNDIEKEKPFYKKWTNSLNVRERSNDFYKN